MSTKFIITRRTYPVGITGSEAEKDTLLSVSAYDNVQRVDMTDTAEEIATEKHNAGHDAYLWLHDSGDCILWPDEDASDGDDGSKAIERWQVDAETAAALDAARIIDGH